MTAQPTSLAEIAGAYDAIVLDQWGVLHDGTSPYVGAIETVNDLHAHGMRMAILSNSGKRAAPNADRIAGIGFPEHVFELVMTSGEALWQDVAASRIPYSCLFPIERTAGDARHWASGLDITLCEHVEEADALLLMGLPDGAADDAFAPDLDKALALDIPIICTNPDRASPRADGHVVTSPGQLAHDFATRGGRVTFYGKPHRPVFEAVARSLNVPPARLLMVGDSLEHDIAGAAGAGWDSVFIRGGLHAAQFLSGDPMQRLQSLVKAEGAPPPTYTLATLGQTKLEFT